MTFLKQKNPVFYVLLVVVVGVWSLVLYMLLSGLANGQNDAVAMGESTTPVTTDSREYIDQRTPRAYIPDYRNPFMPPPDLLLSPPVVAAKDTSEAPAAPPPKPPELHLKGIVGPTAILADAHGAIYFARSGEEVLGVQISQVKQATVQALYKETAYTLALFPNQQ